METKIEFYPITGYVVEIITPDGTYQLCGEHELEKAECNKETLDEIFKNFNIFPVSNSVCFNSGNCDNWIDEKCKDGKIDCFKKQTDC